MRILVDCDGVLSDFIGHALNVIVGVTGRAYGRSANTEWDFGNLLHTPEECRRFWGELQGPGVAWSLQPLPGARARLAALRAAGHEVLVVTSPLPGSPTWAYERERWLEVHMGVPKRNVIHAHDKTWIGGDRLIDDNADNVLRWYNAHRRDDGCAEAYLVDAPYNRPGVGGNVGPDGLTYGGRVYRVTDWADILRRLGVSG